MLNLPATYQPTLDIRQRETAIKDIKDFFERELAAALGLVRVTAPVAVRSGLGINDDLNGIEQPVRFSVRETGMRRWRSFSRWPSGNGWRWPSMGSRRVTDCIRI